MPKNEPADAPAEDTTIVQLVPQGGEQRPLTVDELRPFFANMPSDIGGLVHELALARYYLAAKVQECEQMRAMIGP